MTQTRRKIIGVIGSHSDAWPDYARPLGALIARRGHHLLTGCGGGVMLEVSRAFHEHPDCKGEVIGIHPVANIHEAQTQHDESENHFVTIPIFTQLPAKAQSDTMPYSLNYVNVLSSDALIALPGAHGTKNEVSLALMCNKPLLLFGPEGTFRDFPDDTVCTNFIQEVDQFLLRVLSHAHGAPVL